MSQMELLLQPGFQNGDIWNRAETDPQSEDTVNKKSVLLLNPIEMSIWFISAESPARSSNSGSINSTNFLKTL